MASLESLRSIIDGVAAVDWRRAAGLDTLEFKHLTGYPGLIHSIFTRHGGYSSGPFSELNIGLSCGDDPQTIAQNRTLMLTALGFKTGVFIDQVHGDDILVLQQGMDYRKTVWCLEEKKMPQPVCADGVVSDIQELGIVIQTADCQAVILFDPVRQVVANVHVGWRGSVANILKKCILVMTDAFGCYPKDIIGGISPSLGPCCAEFIHYRKELPKTFWPYRCGKSDCFDFWQISRMQLVEMGIPSENVAAANICTKCHCNHFFSYRTNRVTGRFGTVVGLKKRCVKKRVPPRL